MPHAQREEPIWSANDRLKNAFEARLWGSLIAATLIHLALFVLWPDMTTMARAEATPVMEALDLPEDIPLPEPPEPVQPPAWPTPVPADLAADVTIGKTDWDSYEPDALPPPPPAETTRTGGGVPWVPHTVRPELINTEEVERALEREWPSILRNAGVGGRVLLHVHVSVDGEVAQVRIGESSGRSMLDEAALRVAEVMRFRPALNRDRRVAVWTVLPVVFRLARNR